MSEHEIDYDSIKTPLGKLVSRCAWLRELFFMALGALFLREWYVKKALRELAQERSDWEIFDAGSGFGQYTHFMARNFTKATIYAIDVKPEQIEDSNWFADRVRDRNCTFEVGDLTEFRQPDAFHLTLCVDVMEHILDDNKVFSNIFASLKEGGYFLMSTPSADEPSDEKVGEVHSFVGEHVRDGYEEKELRRKLEKAGFRVLYMKRSYGPWGLFAWRLLQGIPMRLLDKSKLYALLLIPYYLVVYLPAAFCMSVDVRTFNTTGGGWLALAQK